MKKIVVAFGILCAAMDVAAQTASDSIAICPPGEPSEELAPAPARPDGSMLMAVDEVAVAADSIIANYDSEWTDLSMQGRLQLDVLPMRVNVKVYMKRGESIILSARASIFGEVARLEACPDSIVLINKHTRTYNAQPLAGLGVDTKAYLRDLQDILLGQVAFPGNGRLTREMAYDSQWISMPEDNALIYPNSDLQVEGTDYGFVMDSSCWQLRSFVLMLKKVGIVLETKYLYGNQGWTLGLEVNLPKKKIQGELELSYPDYNPTPLEFTPLAGKYRKVDFKQLLKF